MSDNLLLFNLSFVFPPFQEVVAVGIVLLNARKILTSSL